MSEKLYAERDIVEQGDYYSRHTSAMTGEGPHSKSDIAAELAHRDIEIARLQSEVERLRGREDALWETFVKLADFLDIDCERAKKIPGKPSSIFCAAIIRKQAEAIEATTKAHEIKSATDDSKCYSLALLDHAQRLRQQADEAEKAGG